jgi:hypothetical protein
MLGSDPATCQAALSIQSDIESDELLSRFVAVTVLLMQKKFCVLAMPNFA